MKSIKEYEFKHSLVLGRLFLHDVCYRKIVKYMRIDLLIVHPLHVKFSMV